MMLIAVWGQLETFNEYSKHKNEKWLKSVPLFPSQKMHIHIAFPKFIVILVVCLLINYVQDSSDFIGREKTSKIRVRVMTMMMTMMMMMMMM